MITPKRLIISRTDSIGDVILTLPVAGIIKEKYPECEILFLGKNYTREIIELSTHINFFINWDDIYTLPEQEQIKTFKELNADTIIHVFPNKKIAKLVKLAGIRNRIGTSHRFFHFFTCNYKVDFTRKKSEIHESQLNLMLLPPVGISDIKPLNEISKYYGINYKPSSSEKLKSLVSKNHFNLILHPKSKGSAREWGLDNYSELIRILPANTYKIFVTGTAEEGKLISGFLENHKTQVTDLTGQFTLKELIEFIGLTDGIVAASTGPLHIAAAMGKLAVGIYAPMKPIHPGRWAPVGKNAHVLVLNKECNDCRKNMDCLCIKSIKPKQVKKIIEENQA